MSLTNFSVFDLKLVVMSLMCRDATSADVSDFSCYGITMLASGIFFIFVSFRKRAKEERRLEKNDQRQNEIFFEYENEYEF